MSPMSLVRPFRSLRARVVIIFFLLILLAMQLIGWYLERSLEEYYVGNYTRNAERQARLLTSFLERYLAEGAHEEHMADYLRDYGRESGLDLLLLDTDARVIAASSGMENLMGSRIVLPEIDRALSGDPSAQQIRERADRDPVLSLAMPVMHGEAIAGALYMNASLGGAYQTLHDVRTILLGATLLALAITGVAAFALAETVTGPVGAITRRAAEMAGGDFSRPIEVEAEDEIGRLAAMFNYMAERLRNTLYQMEEEKHRLEVVLTNMADGVLALDSEGRIMLANPRALELMDAPGDEVMGRPIGEVLREAPLESPIAEVLRDGEQVTVRFQLSSPFRVIRSHIAPLLPDEVAKDPRGLVVVFQDITEQEEEELRRKEFVANVSHELKTPITTIKSYTETLLGGAADDDEVRDRFLGVVLDESDRMTRMVRDLLDLSLMDSGKMEWHQEMVELPDLVDEACGKLAARADEKGVSLGYREGSPVPPVRADRDRILQVLVNLITNAVDYTPDGGQVRVVWGREGQRARVAVVDDGIGIPAADVERIFERFYRVEKGRARDSGGTGLGLAIAREIVESHGGEMRAESREGLGTRMTFFLPLDGVEDEVAG